jgi:transcription antitermination factor NusG
MSFLSRLWRLIRREPEVASLVANLEKQKTKLQAASVRLKQFADEREEAAKAALEHAKATLAESERAKRIADKFKDLID